MRVLNLGSLNIDRVYALDDFVRKGETVLSKGLRFFCGGKGLNQTIALANAGCDVTHLGAVGADGQELIEKIRMSGAQTRMIRVLDGESGHAVIQVDQQGDNCIIVYGGANQRIGQSDIDAALTEFAAGDYFLCQNETSELHYAVHAAKSKGMYVVVNPSPINETVLRLPPEDIDCLVLNEIEAKAMGRADANDYAALLEALQSRYPQTMLVMTVGGEGVLCKAGRTILRHGIYPVPVADTTAAGDAFCGYMIAGMSNGRSIAESLKIASMASAITVSRMGAADSIPKWREVEEFAKKQGEPLAHS